MRFLHAIPLFLSLLAVVGTAAAQSVPEKGRWSGRVSLNAGAGYVIPSKDETELPDTLAHVRQSSEGLVRYDNRKFGAALLVRQSMDRKNTDGNKMIFTQQDPDDFSQLDVNTRKTRDGQAHYDVRSDLRWTPFERTRLTGFVTGSFQRDTSLNSILELKLVEDRLSVTTEEVDDRRKSFGSGLRGEQLFSKSRSLTGSFEWRREWNGKHSHWSGNFIGIDGVRDRIYRLTPNSVLDCSNALVCYRDSTFAGVSGLLFEPGIRMTITRDNDHFSGATQRSDGAWQDSLRLREHYDFITATFEPYARADFRRENLSAYLEAGLQLYGTRLDNDTLHQAMDMHPVKPIGRQGSYSTQLFIGNPDLMPTQISGNQLGYRFQFKRFPAEYTSSYTRRDNEVVRTFSNYEIDGNLQLILPKSWTLTTDVNYHSRIKTLYQIIDPYVRLNARVQKKFGSAWTLSLEGRDLLEKRLMNGVISRLTEQTWVEETRQNRRVVQLGVVC